MDCLACELTEDPRLVPGRQIATLGNWIVEHCIGPLGVGTVIVKPTRHVIHLADLHADEAAELGPVLARVARAVTDASSDVGDPPGQVYACLWSHADRKPGHIHFVIQPVGEALMGHHDAHGPELQVRMFRAGDAIDQQSMIEAVARIHAHLHDQVVRGGISDAARIDSHVSLNDAD